MKKIFYAALPALALAVTPIYTYAICPVCVIAIGAGLGLSEYLGIDDTIAGLWIGGLLVAMILWTIDWFNRKKWWMSGHQWRDLLTALAYYILTIWPLWAKGLIGHPYHQFWGVDKLILGITIGSIAFIIANLTYNDIKKKNGGHAQFPFQKVVLPVSTLLVLSIIFYFLTK
jgi:cellobiose-specific phosphotransferase system component IIC